MYHGHHLTAGVPKITLMISLKTIPYFDLRHWPLDPKLPMSAWNPWQSETHLYFVHPDDEMNSPHAVCVILHWCSWATLAMIASYGDNGFHNPASCGWYSSIIHDIYDPGLFMSGTFSINVPFWPNGKDIASQCPGFNCFWGHYRVVISDYRDEPTLRFLTVRKFSVHLCYLDPIQDSPYCDWDWYGCPFLRTLRPNHGCPNCINNSLAASFVPHLASRLESNDPSVFMVTSQCRGGTPWLDSSCSRAL